MQHALVGRLWCLGAIFYIKLLLRIYWQPESLSTAGARGQIWRVALSARARARFRGGEKENKTAAVKLESAVRMRKALSEKHVQPSCGNCRARSRSRKTFAGRIGAAIITGCETHRDSGHLRKCCDAFRACQIYSANSNAAAFTARILLHCPAQLERCHVNVRYHLIRHATLLSSTWRIFVELFAIRATVSMLPPNNMLVP